MSRHHRAAATIIALALGVNVFVAACDAGANQTSTLAATALPDRTTLSATDTSCIGSWHATAAGPRTFTVTNRGRQTVQISFINAETGSIYGQILQLDPGTTRPLQTDPPAGWYRFRCIPRRGVALVSASARITGTGGDAATVLRPLSAEEIVTAVSVYRQGVRRGIDQLVTDTASLCRAVRGASWSLAKRRWLVAHLDFARLGAAYGSFGALSDRIDGRADGLPRGVRDPSFTGFLAIEHSLWHAHPQPQVDAVTAELDDAVHTLRHRLPHLTLLAGDLPLRAHEILENALQFELTGDTDEGSHTNLATVLANVQGTQLVIRALTPSLDQRRPGLLTEIDAGLANFAQQLTALRSGSSHWPAIASLPRAVREHLDASIDGLLEQLALLPGVLTLPPSLALP